MAIQIIDDPNRNPSLGKSIGRGVTTGLKSLLDAKIADKHRQPIVNSLMQIGVDPHSADYISRQPSEVQQKLLQDYSGAVQQQMPQQQGIEQYQQPQAYQAQSYPQHGGGQYQQGQAQATPFGGKKREEFAQKQRLAQQNAINRMSAPFMKKSSAAIENAENILREALRLKELKAGGNVSSGLAGRRPLFLQSSDSEQYEKSGNALAQMLAQSGTGVPTGFRIKFAQSQKPGLGMQSRTQDELTDRIIEEAQKIIAKGEIRDRLIEENGYEIPANLETLVNKQWKEYQKNPLRLVEDIRQSEQQSEQEQSQQSAPSEQYDTSQESPLGSVVRRGLSGVARAGEALVGAPGDIASLGLGAANWASGGATPTYEDIQKKLPVSLPTSQQLHEATGRATKGYTNPQGTTEESIDNVVGIVSSLFLPSKFKPSFIKGLGRILNPSSAKVAGNVLMPFSGSTWQKALKVGLAGEAGSRSAEALGAGPAGQGATKLAFMTLAGIHGTRAKIQEAQKSAYAARDAVIEGPLSQKNTIPIDKTIDKVKAFVAKTSRGSAPDRELMLDIAGKVEKGLEKSKALANAEGFPGKAAVADVLTQDKQMNKWYGLGSKQHVAGEQFLPKTARADIAELGRILDEPLAKYGEKYPQFGKNHALGNDLQKGLAYANQADTFFKGGGLMSTSLKSFVAKTLLKGAGKIGAQKAAEAFQLISKSPVAMKYYKEAMIAAAQGNSLAAIRAAVKLDNEALRLEKKSEKSNR